jgi:hypothetical protein
MLARRRPEVGDRRGHQQHVARVELFLTGGLQLGRGRDLATAHSRRHGQRHVGGDDHHLGTTSLCRMCQSEAHPPGGAVADEAHAVDRLARAAGGDEHPQPAPARGHGERCCTCLEDARGLGQTTDALLAFGGQPTAVGRDDLRAARAQDLQVRLRRRTLIHTVVHRRCDDKWAVGDERATAEQVVGETVRELCDRVRCGGSYDVEVGVGDELEMAERLVRRERLAGERATRGIALELVDQHRSAGQRRERSLADEPPARGRLYDTHGVPGGGRQTHQLERLVRGDAAADAEQDSGHDLVLEGAAMTGKRRVRHCASIGSGT